MSQNTEWKDTQLPESRCPYCNYKLDAAGSPEGATPSEGDWTVCLQCASPLVFNSDLNVRKPTVVDLAELKADKVTTEMINSFQRVVRAIDRRNIS